MTHISACQNLSHILFLTTGYAGANKALNHHCSSGQMVMRLLLVFVTALVVKPLLLLHSSQHLTNFRFYKLTKNYQKKELYDCMG